LLTIKSTNKVQEERNNQEAVWDKIPSYGREALIATIDDELTLIRALKTENKDQYRKRYFFDSR
jgi:hypothetical protein